MSERDFLWLNLRDLPYFRAMLRAVEAGFYQDSLGYSPLLESGRARKMGRYTTRLEYQHPLTRSSYWAAGFEATSQRSNIRLFQVDSHGPYLQWRGSCVLFDTLSAAVLVRAHPLGPG